jgi:hypothetical protein
MEVYDGKPDITSTIDDILNVMTTMEGNWRKRGSPGTGPVEICLLNPGIRNNLMFSIDTRDA